MKRKYLALGIIVLVLTIFGSFSLNASAANPPAVFKMTPIQAIPGEAFSTTVFLEENSNLSYFGLQLFYDASIVRLVEATVNENLSGAIDVVQNQDGALFLSYSRSSSLTTRAELIYLTFYVEESTGPGTYSFLTVGSESYPQPISAFFDPIKIYQMGDVNQDGFVFQNDATELRKYLVGSIELTPYQMKLADTFSDGKVSISDATYIQQYIASGNNSKIILGNIVYITFYDKDGNKLFIKSVERGEQLLRIPDPPEVEGFTNARWSINSNRDEVVDFSNLQNHVSVYARYDRQSPAMTFYKEKLGETYFSEDELSGNLMLINDLLYQNGDGQTAKIYWSSSNNATLNATTGAFSKPTYDSSVKLTATIVAYRNGFIDEQDTVEFDYNVLGVFQCPTLEEIRQYLSGFFGDSIDANIALPRKVTNDDVNRKDKIFEVRVSWAVIANDNSEQGITQISRTAYEQSVTLVAIVTFNGVPINGSGRIYFDNITLTAITEKEVRDYIIDRIASYQGLSLTTNETLWNYDTKYDAHVRWISKNVTIAAIADNRVIISDFAVNGSALPMIAEVTYPSGKGAITFELQYTVSIVNSNRLLAPGINIDEQLYVALRSATGSGGTLTTDALKNPKFVYLDLSGYPEITDLSGLTYCTNLRVLNISGLRITRGLNEIASLSKLEVLMARDCGFYDNSLTDGGIPILKNMIYLQMLDLSHNNFTNLNSVFDESKRYGRLLELYVNYNQLTDISALTRAPLLRFMELSNNQLTSDDLDGFKNFKLLKYLSLANNQITSLLNIKDNRTLMELRLQGNQISDVRDLRLMTALQSLYLGNNKLKNVYIGSVEGNISYLKYLTALEILYLNDNDIEDINDLSTLTEIASLNVSGNRIQSLSFLSQRGSTMVELYAENNEIQTFSFVQNLTKLRKLMLSGNSPTYESALSGYLSGLTQLETLTLNGKDLRTLSFLSDMTKLIRFEAANCNLASYLINSGSVTDGIFTVTSYTDNIAYVRGLASTIRFLDVSGNGLAYEAADMKKYLEKNGTYYTFSQMNFSGSAPTRFSSLYELTRLFVLYADNLVGSLNAPNLFSLMSEIRYVSLENCGITDISWLSKFRRLIYVDLAGNNLSTFNLGGFIHPTSRGTLLYLYIDSRTPFRFVNSYTTFDDSVLRELSMINVQLGEVDYLPDMDNLEYLNISYSDITDLRGSLPDFYEIFSLERFKALKTIDVSYVQSDTSVLKELPKLEAVYAVGTVKDKAFYESNIRTLYSLYNRGVDCWLYDDSSRYKPVAETEGVLILGEIEDLSCDVTVGANYLFSNNNPYIPDKVNDFSIAWTLSNPINYAIVNNHLFVRDQTNIADETLTVTAHITVYPDQPPVMRAFTVNVNINKHLVSFESNGGSEVDPIILAYGSLVPKPADPARNGYTFQGWFKDAACTTEWKFNTDTVLDETVLYAKWGPIRYSVNFDSNGGSSVNSVDVEFGRLIPKPAPDPALTDYRFLGWFKDTELKEEWNFSVDVVEGPTTLYAKWVRNTCQVSFESNGGSFVSPIDAMYGSVISMPPNPTLDHHRFIGWYQDENLTTEWNFSTDFILSPITLYARWERILYQVAFNSNGGTAVDPVSVLSGNKVAKPTNPTKTDSGNNYTRIYSLTGWFKDVGLTQEWNFNTDVATGNTTLYAKWNLSKATVTLKNYGTSGANQWLVGWQDIGTATHYRDVSSSITPGRYFCYVWYGGWSYGPANVSLIYPKATGETILREPIYTEVGPIGVGFHITSLYTGILDLDNITGALQLKIFRSGSSQGGVGTYKQVMVVDIAPLEKALDRKITAEEYNNWFGVDWTGEKTVTINVT